MELQNIIVAIIITGSAAYTAVNLFRFFSNPVHKCEGCSGCSLSELKHEIELKKKGI
ncbi:MAG: hypothetical protein WCO44_08975 [Bacteroidota bacterium]